MMEIKIGIEEKMGTMDIKYIKTAMNNNKIEKKGNKRGKYKYF